MNSDSAYRELNELLSHGGTGEPGPVVISKTYVTCCQLVEWLLEGGPIPTGLPEYVTHESFLRQLLCTREWLGILKDLYCEKE